MSQTQIYLHISWMHLKKFRGTHVIYNKFAMIQGKKYVLKSKQKAHDKFAMIMLKTKYKHITNLQRSMAKTM